MASLVSCGSPQKSDGNSDQSKLNVVTVFLTITMFTEAVAGECATVTALIPPNLGPHDFQATPSGIAALSNASVLVKNGLGMEYFLEKLTASAENDSLKVIDTSRGVAVIESEEEDGDHGGDHGEVNPTSGWTPSAPSNRWKTSVTVWLKPIQIALTAIPNGRLLIARS